MMDLFALYDPRGRLYVKGFFGNPKIFAMAEVTSDLGEALLFDAQEDALSYLGSHDPFMRGFGAMQVWP